MPCGSPFAAGSRLASPQLVLVDCKPLLAPERGILIEEAKCRLGSAPHGPKKGPRPPTRSPSSLGERPLGCALYTSRLNLIRRDGWPKSSIHAGRHNVDQEAEDSGSVTCTPREGNE